MGWDPRKLSGNDFLLLSTQGGIRRPDGSPVALGFHTGHWEVGLLMEAAAAELALAGGVPFAAFCSDPCDGRTQGTTGMFDSLPYRNDAAVMFRRQIRSLPTCKGVVGIATCDKGLPAMMMALAGVPDLPVVLVPGGVSLLSEETEDLGKIQTIGARFPTVKSPWNTPRNKAAEPAVRLGRLPIPRHRRIKPSRRGSPRTQPAPFRVVSIWRKRLAGHGGALRPGIAQTQGERADQFQDFSPDSLHNAMALHAAFGGSTNLILHIPAIAHAAGLPRPAVADWTRINQAVPRLVDALPNGPRSFATVQVFLAGGVPEVMLHLREAGLLKLDAMTVSGETLGANLEWWERSERRQRLRAKLHELDGIDPDDVIMSPARAREGGLASTVTFLTGNLCPEGALIKSTAIAQIVSMIPAGSSTRDPPGSFRMNGKRSRR